jgi:uncharacterized protein
MPGQLQPFSNRPSLPPFSLLVKPTSADCNLNCDYCFYQSRKDLYPDATVHRMSDIVLEQLMKTYMRTNQDIYSICWQGGEPSLMGLDFFSKTVELQKKYGAPGSRISNSVQTNATLMTDQMAALFAKYHFLVGCSLDGPQDIHDRYRKTVKGNPTHEAVINGIRILQRHHVAFNILTLVSRANVHQAKEVYHYLKKMGFFHHQYIPCVEFDEHRNLMPFAITGDQWGRFLCDLFDAWYPKDLSRVSIRNFESILSKKINGTPDVCVMGDNCCSYFVVEYNGDVYPCDFFVDPSLKLGNIMETSWEEMFHSPVYRKFGALKKQWNPKCTVCDHLDFCAGDCLKNRLYNDNLPQNISWLCPGLTAFFTHTQKKFDTLAEKIILGYGKEQKSIDKIPKSGRNDPCPCGSGLKFKRCCKK